MSEDERYPEAFVYKHGDIVRVYGEAKRYKVIRQRCTWPDVMPPFAQYGLVPETPDGESLRWESEADVQPAGRA